MYMEAPQPPKFQHHPAFPSVTWPVACASRAARDHKRVHEPAYYPKIFCDVITSRLRKRSVCGSQCERFGQ